MTSKHRSESTEGSSSTSTTARAPAAVEATSGSAPDPLSRSYEVWLARGSEATDPAERVLAFETLIALCDGAIAGAPSRDFHAEKLKGKAEWMLEMDRIATLDGEAKVDALLASAKRFQGGESQDLWRLAAACAVDLACWRQAEEAGARLVELAYVHSCYEHCQVQVLALHELGRDEEALKVLKTALERIDSHKEHSRCLVAIPWSEARKAGTLQRKPEDAAFEARCFALATEVLPENPFARKWRDALASAPSERVGPGADT